MKLNVFRYRTGLVLLLSLLCAAMAWLLDRRTEHEQTGRQVAQRVEHDLQESEGQVYVLLQDSALLSHLAVGKLNRQEERRMAALPFHLYAGTEEGLYYWNTNLTGDEQALKRARFRIQATQLLHYTGVLIKQRLPGADTSRFLAAFIPISVSYPYENAYLASNLLAAPQSKAASIRLNPSSIRLTAQDEQPVRLRSGSVIAILEDIHTTPGNQPVGVPILVCAAVLLLMLWMSIIAVSLSVRGRFLAGLGVMLGGIGLAGIIVFVWRPLLLGTWHYFSPQWYAGGKYLSSLGTVMMIALSALYLLGYLAYGGRFPWPRPKMLLWRRWLISVATAAIMAVAFCAACHLLRSLVADATEDFSPNRLTKLTAVSAAFLSTISLVVLAVGSTIYVAQWWPGWSARRQTRQLALVLLMSLCMAIALLTVTRQEMYLSAAYSIIMSGVLVSRMLKPRGAQLNVMMVLWMALASGLSASYLHLVNNERDQAHRQNIATRLATERDDLLEWHFENLARNIVTDDSIRQFILHPGEFDRSAIDRHIMLRYLTSNLNNYNVEIYLFGQDSTMISSRGRILSLAGLQERFKQSEPTKVPGFYYHEDGNDAHIYNAQLPIRDDSSRPIGTLYLDLSRKQTTARSVYPELLLPLQLQVADEEDQYIHAVYHGSKLMNQSRKYPFPEFMKSAWTGSDITGMQLPGGGILYRYEPVPDRTVMLVSEPTAVLEHFTLFSYLFGMLLLTIGASLGVRLLVLHISRRLPWRNMIMMPMKTRIQAAMLLLVLISFVGIGMATISFLQHRYRRNADSHRLSVLVGISNRIRLFQAQHNVQFGPALSGDPEFKELLLRYATLYDVDINIFGPNGQLLSTSQDAVFDQGLLSPIISLAVYTHDWTTGPSFLLEEETLGSLHYTSAYLPLHRQDGDIEGYLNVPFFNSQQELQAQIISVIVTLINLFVILFLISGLLSLPLSRWMTRSLETIAKRMEGVDVLNKTRNEPLDWPYDDAIGMLVRQYNLMLQSLDESARKLEHASREEAWREMAQQIAHEVKNPLMPMKLSVQYLQKAIREGRPNIEAMTGRAAEGLLEQIEHLSHIASGFSAFARMPAAQPERVQLNDFLTRASQLYYSMDGLDFHLHLPDEALVGDIDTTWLQSILTNLLENAAQALAMQDYARVDLRLLRKDDYYAQVTVEDNGPGIDEETKEKMFRPYFTTKSSGTGLGLAMVRRMAEGMGGRIWFESETGKGTVFFLDLPLASDRAGLPVS